MPLWKPEAFQGSLRSKGYFEGVYYKLVDGAEKEILALIPGVALGKDDPHAFLQVFRGNGDYHYLRRSLETFSYSRNTLDIRLRGTSFTGRRIILDLSDEKLSLRGELGLHGGRGWPVRLTSPGAMGPYGLAPLMQCYYQIINFDCSISGALELDGRELSYEGGRAYVEKNWGRSFPKAWIWTQTNHFPGGGISLIASLADIPWLFSSFPGFIVGLHLRGELYRFATYTGAKLRQAELDDEHLRLRFEDDRLGLLIEAQRREGVPLAAPRLGAMDGTCEEYLGTEIEIELYRRSAGVGRRIYAGRGSCAGLEINGPVEKLVADLLADKRPPKQARNRG